MNQCSNNLPMFCVNLGLFQRTQRIKSAVHLDTSFLIYIKPKLEFSFKKKIFENFIYLEKNI